MNKKKYLWSIDDFSSEDYLISSNPEQLGWNLAAATISDIYACGGIPEYYSHSVTLDSNWDNKYILKFCTGIKKALQYAGVEFIAGDLSIAKNWKYTGTVIGKSDEKFVCRKGACPGDKIYITGKTGSGNLEAILKLNQNNTYLKEFFASHKFKLPIRKKESGLIKKYASSCIDTSDGLINALNTISMLNKTGFLINNPELIKESGLISKIMHLPEELLLAGECGEYELLFTVNPKKAHDFLTEAKNNRLKFYCLGQMLSSFKSKILMKGKIQIDISDFNFRARDFINPETYIESMCNFFKGKPY
ncbi:MAG: thiamine-monophosphate kinase [Candidatus Aureabacteria bacterium]|nr:thiamine-monophosphate kinase [Candidatus Auribacterota bacterium]